MVIEKWRKNRVTDDSTRNNEFMMKEYEKMYDLFNLHYSTSEKIFKLYLIILGFFFTICSYLYKDNLTCVNIFILPPLVKYVLFFVCIAGFLLFMMNIEHRIKTIFYVHNLNSLRNFFSDKNQNIKEYLLLSIDKNHPPYFILFKDFFWEVCILAISNSILISILVLNLFKWESIRLLIIFWGVLFLLHLLCYKLRSII
jgi:hypothetical protein